jgi:hypothetical protein
MATCGPWASEMESLMKCGMPNVDHEDQGHTRGCAGGAASDDTATAASRDNGGVGAVLQEDLFNKREIPIVSLAALFPAHADADGESESVPPPPEVVSELAQRLRGICHDIGFFVVVDHGIPQELTAQVFDLMKRFFALPDDVKATIDKNLSRHFRGWEPVGTERTNGRVDVREQIDVWTEREALDPNVVPVYNRLQGDCFGLCAFHSLLELATNALVPCSVHPVAR